MVQGYSWSDKKVWDTWFWIPLGAPWKPVSRNTLEILFTLHLYPDTAWKSVSRYSLETCIQILMQLANLYPGTVWNETSIQAEAIKKPNLTSELNINQTKNLDSILLFRHSLSSHSSPRPLPTLRPFFYPSPPFNTNQGGLLVWLSCRLLIIMSVLLYSSLIHGSVVQFVIYSWICCSICLLFMDL